MDKPLVSAIIPVYNGSNYINDAINSVLKQTYSNIEIIVIDDGSTDNTWEIIKTYGDKIKGIHKDNGGVSSALNVGIKNMAGTWFAWLSHDDCWHPEKIEKQIEYVLNNPECYVCYTGTNSIDEKGDIIEYSGTNGLWYSSGDNIRRLVKQKNYISGITPIVHRSCFQKVGVFNENYRYGQDLDMWIRLMCHYQFDLIPEQLASGRIHSMQVGARLTKRCLDEYRMICQSYLTKTMYPYYFPRCKNNIVLKIRCMFFVIGCYLNLWILNPMKQNMLSIASKYIPTRIKKTIHRCLKI